MLQPATAEPIPTHSAITISVTTGPATATLNSPPGVSVSRDIFAMPPKNHRSMPMISIPCLRAASACPSSCSTSEAKNSRALATAVRYATVSLEFSVSRKDPERMKMKKKRTRNQLTSTPMRIPKTRASWIEPLRPNIV